MSQFLVQMALLTPNSSAVEAIGVVYDSIHHQNYFAVRFAESSCVYLYEIYDNDGFAINYKTFHQVRYAYSTYGSIGAEVNTITRDLVPVVATPEEFKGVKRDEFFDKPKTIESPNQGVKIGDDGSASFAALTFTADEAVEHEAKQVVYSILFENEYATSTSSQGIVDYDDGHSLEEIATKAAESWLEENVSEAIRDSLRDSIKGVTFYFD